MHRQCISTSTEVLVNDADCDYLMENHSTLKILLNRQQRRMSLPEKSTAEDRSYQELQCEEKEQLMYQIPPQDFNPKKCGDDEFEANELDLFRLIVQETSFGRAETKFNHTEHEMKCLLCCGAIHMRDSYKFADRLPDSQWHCECFKCHQCEAKLMGDIYFAHENNIYCGRHYGELLKNRCVACDELIFSQKFTNADGQNWHRKHFYCNNCCLPLNDKHYVVIGNQQTMCVDCYHDNVADRCQSCNQPIEAGKQRVRFESCNWHADGSCFSCAECGISLLDVPFIKTEDKTFCSEICLKTVSMQKFAVHP